MKKNTTVLSSKKDFTSEDEVIDELLRLRNIVEERKSEFFHPTLQQLRLDGTGIDHEMLQKAIDRIIEAIGKNEKIIIYGDYDVDGITASAILWETIYAKYKNVFPYLPDRFSEGYGISKNGIDNLLKVHPDAKLIVTVDNGIVAHDAVDYAREKGLEVVITDHHVASEVLPDASAIVHTTELCGAGVAWMLSRELGFENSEKIHEKLELAALATVADLVPLTGLNRVIVKLGLEYLRKTKRAGLRALYDVARIESEKVDTYHIGFVIGPRLNASGRIAHAMESLRLLCTSDREYARYAAQLLDETNKERQQMVFTAAQHAKLAVLKEPELGKVIVVYSETYSEGIVGLIASKLVEEYYRPALAISVGEKIAKGSARSIKGVNIIELIRKHEAHLVGAGGHPMAAGFSIELEKIETFKTAITGGGNESITDELLTRTTTVDMEIPAEFVTEGLYEKLEQLAPFGMGNPKPTFLVSDVTVKTLRKLGKDGAHLKLQIEKDGIMFDTIGFGMGEEKVSVDDTISVVCRLDMNEWQGRKSLQLKLSSFS